MTTKAPITTENRVRIRLIRDLPVKPEHGATRGREYDAAMNEPGEGRSRVRWWIESELGERVGVLSHEAEVIDANNT
jgi:hypothetical protein